MSSPYEPPESDPSPPSSSNSYDGDLQPRGPATPPSTGDLLRELWEIIQERPGPAIGYSVLVAVVMGFVNFIGVFGTQFAAGFSAGLLGPESGTANLAMAAGTLLMGGVILLVMTVMNGALNVIWLRTVRGQTVELSDLWYVRHVFAPLLVANLAVGAATFVGLALLVVPGIIAGLGLSMALAIVVDHDVGGLEAAKRSWNLMSGHKLAFALHFFAITGIAMLFNCLTCGAGGVLVTPAMTGGVILFYDYLTEPGNAYLSPR